ncbi:LIM zinc-binding domain-containing protein [Meloidogyne graminicola]|uniref:LIM zinc-binding domain-containing protein n=1 Tax=Meloidogyne graminicola TaxID=189291 RepID=A0A8S9ZTF2_9BILA|nr:LIM zinc-binding domain-containing protein [Meloidogyne graminicola]
MVAGGCNYFNLIIFLELCNKALDSTNVSPHEALLFCCKCHARKYGPKGVGFGVGGGVLTMDMGERFGNRQVEMTKRKIFFLFPLLGMCNKPLDSTNACPHEAELFCKQCHGRKFGPKGVGFGLGAGSLTMDSGERFGGKSGE